MKIKELVNMRVDIRWANAGSASERGEVVRNRGRVRDRREVGRERERGGEGRKER